MKKFIFGLVALVFMSAILDVAAQEISRPIGIMHALPQEGALLTVIKDQQTVKHGSDKFVTGTLSGIPVVITMSGMGKVNAAITAQRLISEFQVKAIIFMGVAGGLNQTLEIGDVLIAKEAFQFDYGFFGKEFVRHPVGVLPEIGIGTGNEPAGYDFRVWPQFSEENTTFFSLVVQYLTTEQSALASVFVNEHAYQPKVRVGVIATGDQFVANEHKQQTLLNQGADAVEMEGGAVAQVANRNNIPCLLLRAISDKAGTHAKLDFPKFFATVAANNALLVEDMFRNNRFNRYFKTF